MKLVITIFTAFTFGLVAKAQNPDKALARVKYNFYHITDTNKKNEPRTETMLLLIGRNASLFTSFDKLQQAINMKKQMEEQMKNSAGGPTNFKISNVGNKPVSQLDYYFFAKEKQFFTKERVFNNYLIEENAPVIDWKISADTASFSSLKCQKATAYFKGRNWIAWFAPEMPFQSGPWKLNGLPGLIVEAYDDKKEVQFLFAGIENVTSATKENPTNLEVPVAGVKIFGMDANTNTDEIKLPTDAIKTTKKELDKLKEARDKDPQGFMNAQLAGSGMGGNIKINTAPVNKTGTVPNKLVVNNPIELADKK